MDNVTVKNFSAVPTTRRPRTLFSPKGDVKTSLSAGKLVPIAVQEILPNTTIMLDLTSVVRGITPKTPVLDNAYLDLYAFFVPNRLSWKNWENFLAEPTPEAYEQAPQYVVPHIQFINNVQPGSGRPSYDYQGYLAGSFWDYSGVGLASGNQRLSGIPSLSALYPRGYVRIWNDWFRDENVQDFAHVYTDDVDRDFSEVYNQSDPLITAEYGKDLLPVSKYKDYFTSALPQAQKGPPVQISLGDTAPVVPNSSLENSDIPLKNAGNDTRFLLRPILYHDSNGVAVVSNDARVLTPTVSTANTGLGSSASSSGTNRAEYFSLSTDYTNQLVADLSSAQAITVNALRLAFQTQRFQEKLARSGSRYTELLQSMFGVHASDGRLQRSEFLGGKRFPITQHQVAQTAENGTDIGLGDTGAFVFMSGKSRHIVNRSFSEHGLLYFLACVRTDQTYSQGVPVQFTRRNRFDFYFPCFAHIGEQPIKRQEIYATSNGDDNDNTFGYKEPWVEYKYFQNRVTAKMRPYVNSNFGTWTYANNFGSAPVLSPQFIVQGVSDLDRTLSVASSVQDQFFADFYFDFKQLILPMPMFNTPGLIDHD